MVAAGLVTALALSSVDADTVRIDAGEGNILRRAANIIREHEADALVDIISSMVPDLKKLDSTDGLPAYETYARNMGSDLHPSASTLAPLWERMTTYVQGEYAAMCPTCYLCTVLLRRYKHAERVHVHTHFDRNAVVTAVAALNGGMDPPQYEGGLFLQRNARSSSRDFIDGNRTSAIFHDYSLNHGVDVRSGQRFSAVFWFSDNEESCRAGHSPWYEAPAARGERFAQEALAELYQLGSSGYARDVPRAAELLRGASTQGSAAAQSKLGRLLLAGEGVPRAAEEGVRWLREAAAQGYAPAEHTMGVACQYGDVDGGLEEAARWFRKAAEAGIAAAQYELGAAYVNGDGVEAGLVDVGAYWLRRAEAQGNREALTDLKTLREDPAWIELEETVEGLEASGKSVEGVDASGKSVWEWPATPDGGQHDEL